MENIGFFLLLVLMGFIGFFFLMNHNAKKKLQSLERKKEIILEKYHDKKRKIEIPKYCFEVEFLESGKIGGKIIYDTSYYLWKNNDTLYFFPTTWKIDFYFKLEIEKIKNPELQKIYEAEGWYDLTHYEYPEKFDLLSIPIQDIVSYKTIGEKHYETKISGGGGGGSSLKRAVVGGVIAGGAGAIIASRKKTDPVSSEFIAHDERSCILTINQDNVKHRLVFLYQDYEVFKELIPEKDIIVIDEIRRKKAIEKNYINGDSNSLNKIKELFDLKKEGIITQQEFERIRKKLIEEI
jgi:hypothetical protein